MRQELLKAAESIIRAGLSEDLGDRGDITSHAICLKNPVACAVIIAKAEGVCAGNDFGKLLFRLFDPAVKYTIKKSDGTRIFPGDVVAVIQGPSVSILEAERTVLNLIGHLSGIATHASLFVGKIVNTKAKILDTRKTTPGWRLLEKYAVRCGGALNHRMGLYDMFMIKDNHITVTSGIAPAVLQCREYMKKNRFRVKIVVEAKTLAEVQDAVNARVDRILLDNMKPATIKKCVRWVAGRIPLEASGGVRLDNVRQIAMTGVDYISIGAITHSAKQLDISLEIL
jgi:nicotinate-nucleotide pyrophosphorylase (carboxylating)